MEEDRKRRRRHSAELKGQVLEACERPGASIAAVALEFGLNANLVRQWRVGRGMKWTRGAAAAAVGDAGAQLKFIALPMPAAVAPAPSEPAPLSGDIRLEIRRGAAVVKVSWPLSAAGQCAAWLREVLR
ncbi:MAG: transposase [Pseudomonadota bacterium]